MRAKLVLILLAFVLPLVAKDKPFDKEQYKVAAMRFDEVSGTDNPKVLKALADSLHTAGRKNGNYQIALLYYDAMALYYYYTCESDEEIVDHIVENYEKGMKEAQESGSETKYWQFFHAKVINQVTTRSMDCIDQANEMLKEVTENHSDYGMMRVYHTLATIYNYRNDMLMAIDMLNEAAKIGENYKGDNEENVTKALCDEVYKLLADYLCQATLRDKAFEVTEKWENHLMTSSVFTEDTRNWRMRDIYAIRAMLYFDQWQYDKFDEQVALLKADPSYDSYINNADKLGLKLYILLRAGREAEVKELMEMFDETEIHSYLYSYYKYHDRVREAIREYEANQLYFDSIAYNIHSDDMDAKATQAGNVQLKEEKLQLEKRQADIVAAAIAGILLIIIVSFTIIMIRHRRHAKELEAKNKQLQIARDEAEEQRAEAVEQRGIAEEQRAEAEEQRGIAEAQRAEAEEQRGIAEEQRAEAEEQRGIAEEQRAEAESQRMEAERQKAEAEAQRAEAERQRSIAEEQRAEALEQRAEADRQRCCAEEQRAEALEQRAEADRQRCCADEQRAIAVKAQKVAERANEMKGEFILSMMHEIRTPLNHIKGFSAIIADPNMHSEAEMMKEASDQISNSTSHLTHLLDDILQLGKFDGMTDVEKADVSAMELLLTAMMNSPQSDPAAVEMIPAIEEVDPELTVPTNMEMAQKALAALINNAVKFTKEGHIKMGIEADDEQVVRFYVEDTGCGVPEGQEERIFERFVKLDEFVPGTGLGLSLADVITQALGGRVYVDKGYAGPGARFVMELPKAAT